jgi:hypothetical protein
MTTLSKLPKANQELCSDAANARGLDHEITFTGTIAQCGRARNAFNADSRLLGTRPTLGEATRAPPTRGVS